MPLPISLDHINLWLLDDHDAQGPGTAIVDTGFNAPVCRDVWQALLPSIRVTRVIATHHHPDHVGLAGWLGERTGAALWRSEEHTSELQSLMRNSYAVFCLKKKKNTKSTQN